MCEVRQQIENATDMGAEMYRLIERLYPICRSITGNGVRESLKLIRQYIPIEIHEVASGTQVFDWTVPDEWNVKDAYIKDRCGNRIVDFRQHNLHVLNYSMPVDKKVSLDELKKHVFTLPSTPDWIPYRTSYHNKAWGFCMSHNQLLELTDENYEVKVDSTLEPGSLSYGELLIKGQSEEEILISTHVCHPSLCNDNLSGIAITTFLAVALGKLNLKYSYRFLFIPGTIGSITWLSRNQATLENVKSGLVACLLGDGGKFHYKKSRRGDSEIDRLVCRVLKNAGVEYNVIDFSPYGYDERQFCSPGFNLPVGRLTRTPNGEFPEYHTSADNLSFVKSDNLTQSLNLLHLIFSQLETAEKYINMKPECEPKLGSRGLYKKIGGASHTEDFQMALLWVLNLSDGEHSLDDISEKSGLEISLLKKVAGELLQTDLLERWPVRVPDTV